MTQEENTPNSFASMAHIWANTIVMPTSTNTGTTRWDASKLETCYISRKPQHGLHLEKLAAKKRCGSTTPRAPMPMEADYLAPEMLRRLPNAMTDQQ